MPQEVLYHTGLDGEHLTTRKKFLSLSYSFIFARIYGLHLILLYMHDRSKKFHLASIEHWPRPRLECRTGGKKLHSALNGTLELDHGAHGHFEAPNLLTI